MNWKNVLERCEHENSAMHMEALLKLQQCPVPKELMLKCMLSMILVKLIRKILIKFYPIELTSEEVIDPSLDILVLSARFHHEHNFRLLSLLNDFIKAVLGI